MKARLAATALFVLAAAAPAAAQIEQVRVGVNGMT